MTGDDHLGGIGKIVGNLHAMEHVLRIFLCEANGENIEYPVRGAAKLAETHLTNYASLDKIVVEYNAGLASDEQQYQVDPVVVKIRDALAHGRVISFSLEFPVTLYKFGKADGNKQVPIEYAEVLTEAWLNEKRTLLREQITKIVRCAGKRAYKSIKS